jgi:hypothetical protein
VRAMEEAALRMELEARAKSVCRWRAQGQASFSSLTTVGLFEAEDWTGNAKGLAAD